MATQSTYPSFSSSTAFYVVIGVILIVILWQFNWGRPVAVILVVIIGLGWLLRFYGPVHTQVLGSEKIINTTL